MNLSKSEKYITEERAYVSRIQDRIRIVLQVRQMTQANLAQTCGFSSASMTKLLKGDNIFNIKQLYTICKALEIQPELLLADQENELDTIERATIFLSDTPVAPVIPAEEDYSGSLIRRYLPSPKVEGFNYKDSILYDPDRPAFRGILNDANNEKDCYYFYTKPTISEEKNSILKGTLRLTPSGTESAYCKAELQLETGQQDENHKKVIKQYSGEMLISLAMKSCYILLFSPFCAEISMISFQHMFLNNEVLSCRLGAVLTTSAGSNRRPTLEKCIISRTELDEKALSELEGQLFINTSKIAILKEVMNAPSQKELRDKLVRAISPPFFDNSMAEADYLDSFFTKSYYEIEEMQIRAALSMDSKEKLALINQLRKLSNNPRYAKVSSTTDQFLYAYIRDLK